jgi:hypothetical protein
MSKIRMARSIAASIPNAPAGYDHVFIDDLDGLLKSKNSGGVVGPIAAVSVATTLAVPSSTLPPSVDAVNTGLNNLASSLIQNSVTPLTTTQAPSVTAIMNYLQAENDKRVGELKYYPTNELPSDVLRPEGQALSRLAYPVLFNKLVKIQTVSLTLGASGLVTWTGHNLLAFSTVKFGTTGGLPTGLVAGTTYYVSPTGLTPNSFSVSATSGGAVISFTGAQSGIHTAVHAPYGDGDGSTTFTLPNIGAHFLRNISAASMQDPNRALGLSQSSDLGSHTHTSTTGGSHSHTTSNPGDHQHSTDSQGSHVHGLNKYIGSTGDGYDTNPSAGVSNFQMTDRTPEILNESTGVNAAGSHAHTTTFSGGHTHTISTDPGHSHTINATGGSETRPLNYAMILTIKVI